MAAKSMRHFLPEIAALVVLALLGGCSKQEVPVAQDDNAIKVGGLYATQDKDGSWRVMKVLALDEHAVHLRSYANRFKQFPKDVRQEELTLGGLNDPAGFGIGHFPLAKEGFFNDKPVLIKVAPVGKEELEGYNHYLKAMSGGS